MITPAVVQVVDDLLDLTGSSSVLGKPALNDMRSGLATAPVSSRSSSGTDSGGAREARGLRARLGRKAWGYRFHR